jgi:response regulator RpfG family c-di-GMP phosphodiesterase
MEKDLKQRFIVIDDDSISNMLCKKVIAKTIPDAEVITFTEPEKGLAYLLTTYEKPTSGNAILFLDINMPSMSGWEFMEQFKEAGETVKKKIHVYILSSSVNPLDKEKARTNPGIVEYLEKPLSALVLKSVI